MMKNQIEIVLVLLMFILFLTSCQSEVSHYKNEDLVTENSLNQANQVPVEKLDDEEVEPENYVLNDEEKALLDKIQAFKISKDVDMDLLIDEMIDNIGSVDSYLRDDNIYLTFDSLVHSEAITEDQFMHIFTRLLSDNRLTYMIGEKDTDSVFTRSFSALNLASLLSADSKKNILTDDDIIYMHERMITYMKDEKDLRGYIDNKGWAHSVAHSADVLKYLSNYSVIDSNKHIDILDVIAIKVVEEDYEYKHGEQERLLKAVQVILQRELVNPESLVTWIDDIVNYDKTGDEEHDRILESNVTLFIEKLSKLTILKGADPLVPSIEKYLNEVE